MMSDEEEEMGEGFFEAIEELERMVRDPSDVLEEMVERLSTRELQLLLVYFTQEGRDSYYALEVFDWLRKENWVDGEMMELMVSIACGKIERLIGRDHAVDDVVALLNEMDCVGLESGFHYGGKGGFYVLGETKEGLSSDVHEGWDEKRTGWEL